MAYNILDDDDLNKISETPSDLVGEGETPTEDEKGKLSPNPAGFGFTKQLIVDSLPAQGEVNTLYLLKTLNDGVLVGYRKYKWTPSDGYVFVGVTPDQKIVNGKRETPERKINAPREAFEKVYQGLVGFNKEPYIKGLPLSDYIDREGGVTEAELNAVKAQLQSQITSVTHKVVTLNYAASGTLSISDFNLVDGDYCVIKFSSTVNDVFYKAKLGPNTNDQIYYTSVNLLNRTQKAIKITRSARTWTYSEEDICVEVIEMPLGSPSSGTFTEEQIASLQKPSTLIKYNYEYYYRNTLSPNHNYITYVAIKPTSAGTQGDCHKEIYIDVSTRAYTVQNGYVIPKVQANPISANLNTNSINVIRIGDTKYPLRNYELKVNYVDTNDASVNVSFLFLTNYSVLQALVDELNVVLEQLEEDPINSINEIPTAIATITSNAAWASIGGTLTTQVFGGLLNDAFRSSFFEEIDGQLYPLGASTLGGLFAVGKESTYSYTWSTLATLIPSATITLTEK